MTPAVCDFAEVMSMHTPVQNKNVRSYDPTFEQDCFNLGIMKMACS